MEEARREAQDLCVGGTNTGLIRWERAASAARHRDGSAGAAQRDTMRRPTAITGLTWRG